MNRGQKREWKNKREWRGRGQKSEKRGSERKKDNDEGEQSSRMLLQKKKWRRKGGSEDAISCLEHHNPHTHVPCSLFSISLTHSFTPHILLDKHTQTRREWHWEREREGNKNPIAKEKKVEREKVSFKGWVRVRWQYNVMHISLHQMVSTQPTLN